MGINILPENLFIKSLKYKNSDVQQNIVSDFSIKISLFDIFKIKLNRSS